MLAMVALFLRLGWWQVRRAGDGNALSYGYALEWPVFAAFTVFVWYRIMRDSVQPPDRTPAPRERTGTAAFTVPTLPQRPATVPEPEDPVLAAYNEYLRRLNDHPANGAANRTTSSER
jgi:DNA-binding transcriptional regulator of glucitol operon